jgi:ribose transport system ATP-binding protein
MTTPRLSMQGIQKRFGATQALRRVNFQVEPGEVHALIGENGAGKSTLMKILSGAYRPDSGHLELDGAPFSPSDPLHALRSGIAMIYQELNLAQDLSVEENILLGAEPSRFGWINRRRRHQVAREALAELDHNAIPLDAPVRTRSVAEKQVIEIARALIGSPKVLIMDEPTSSLTQVDTQNLFRVIGRLRQRGVSVIYISHFLEECQTVADRFTVLRDGETVETGAMAEADLSRIIRLMVGREISEIYPRTTHAIGEPVLELHRVAGTVKPRSASFVLRKGEILGIAGLVGAGRTETLRVLFGLDPIRSGTIRLGSREATRNSPAQRLRDGMGLLSENRKEEGLLLNRSLADNLTLTRLRPFCTGGFIRRWQQRKCTETWLQQLGVRARDASQSVSELSGGNQQKIAVGRLLHHEAEILLLDEPTRGIDVASKAQIYKLMAQLAADGKSIVFVSSYLPELLGVCDTIAVMCRGMLTEVRPASHWTEHSIIAAAIGQFDSSVAL